MIQADPKRAVVLELPAETVFQRNRRRGGTDAILTRERAFALFCRLRLELEEQPCGKPRMH